MDAPPQQPVFDMPHYRRLNESREVFLKQILPPLVAELGIRRAADIGCGIGFFSELLRTSGFNVLGVDGRQQNVEEAKRRFPEIEFRVANAEETVITELGTFDLVLCFGLLYHLESPFRAIRNLAALTGKALLIDSTCIPGERPVLLFREEFDGNDQGLKYVALYPTESCLVKMLYQAGFIRVYRFRLLPDHPYYSEKMTRKRVRTFLLAVRQKVTNNFVEEIAEPTTEANPWATKWTGASEFARVLRRFLRRPLPEKMASLRRRLGLNRGGNGADSGRAAQD